MVKLRPVSSRSPQASSKSLGFFHYSASASHRLEAKLSSQHMRSYPKLLQVRRKMPSQGTCPCTHLHLRLLATQLLIHSMLAFISSNQGGWTISNSAALLLKPPGRWRLGGRFCHVEGALPLWVHRREEEGQAGQWKQGFQGQSKQPCWHGRAGRVAEPES